MSQHPLEPGGTVDGTLGSLRARLRAWTPADCDRVHAIANHPSVRRVSIDSKNIPLSDHREWFQLAIDEVRPYFAIDVEGVVAGYVRFDEGEIAIAIAPEYRGMGLAVPAIRAACEWWGKSVVARVRESNVPSRRAFARAGFRETGRETVNGVGLLRFNWS